MFEVCTHCKLLLQAKHYNLNYMVAGGSKDFRGRGGYNWEHDEKYCIEHWRRWLRWGLASAVDCEAWIAWAEEALTRV